MKKLNISKHTHIFIASILLFSGYCMSQPQEVIANYPLIDDLIDVTGNNNDMILVGNPIAPEPPSNGIEMCSNGIYVSEPDGQDIITPIMPTFDINNFTIEVEFKVTALPNDNGIFSRMPVIMGSRNARWLGIYLDVDGNIGFKHNNHSTNYEWSNTSIGAIGTWYSSKISYVNGHVELFFEDQLILTGDVGPLITWMNTFNFTVTDFSEGNAFNGCIRNLIISSTPDEVFKNSFE